jgi:uncharacterized protein (TIGR02145 family)
MVLTPDTTNVASDTTVHFTQDGTQSGAPLTGMTGNFTTSGANTRDGSGTVGDAANPNSDVWRQNDIGNVAYCADGRAYSSSSKTGCGYLYNYYTAAAGANSQTNIVVSATAQVASSICPAGWRLPTTINDARGGYYDRADVPVLNASMHANALAIGTTNNHYVDWHLAGSFRGVLANSWDYGPGAAALSGHYWSSSSAGNDFNSRSFGFNTSSVLVGPYAAYRRQGLAVRCVATENYTPTNSAPLAPIVKFGSVPATNVSISADGKTITATVPASAVGKVSVAVGQGASAVTLPQSYEYTLPQKVPSTPKAPNTGLTPTARRNY